MLNRDPLAHPQDLIRRVYSFVAYRLGDGADAEDVTSATFERALKYRRTYDPSREPLPWLIGIARRCIADHLDERLLTTREVPDVAAPGELDRDTALRLDVARVLDRLDARDREVVALRFGADLTARQIADVLGLRVNTVEVALHRVLARLRRELGEPERAKPAVRKPAPSGYSG